MKKKPNELRKSFDFQAPVNEEQADVVSEEFIARKFPFRLVVRNAFNNYTKGQVVFKDEEIQSIIDGNFLRHCCKSPY